MNSQQVIARFSLLCGIFVVCSNLVWAEEPLEQSQEQISFDDGHAKFCKDTGRLIIDHQIEFAHSARPPISGKPPTPTTKNLGLTQVFGEIRG